MLDRGDDAVLVAPVADFYRELDRMHRDAPPFQAVTSTNSFAEETLDAETTDLRAALKKAGKTDADAERIVIAHLAERGKLQKYATAFQEWTGSAPVDWNANGHLHHGEPAGKEPAFPAIAMADDLPAEFADYFAGAIAWNDPSQSNKTAARQAWERLLKRPARERHYKSTWAAFMLGRYWETDDPKKARDYFKEVRELAAEGFADPTGLAAASIGWEARLALRADEFQTAIQLYLQQYAANGWGSGESLQVALGRAVHAGPKALAPLAINPQTRRLVTAYLISQRLYDESSAAVFRENTKAWLEAVEQADVKDVESAEQFALAAYQANEMELALRWVNRAPNSPTAQWLMAKLLLRAGRVGQATEVLSRIVESFPMEAPTNTANADTPFAENLSVPDATENDPVPAGRYIRGELGALRLSRREYTQALDLLLRGGFWTDAAYVAEHVLTTEELKNYVDDTWPAIEPSSDDNKSETEKANEKLTSNIRYLLARRLTRESHGPDARAYFPPEQLPAYEGLMQALNNGWDESLAQDERAKALSAAAFIARTNGMELLGTEAAPDWHMYDGSFTDYGVTLESRTNGDAEILAPSADELKRNAASVTDPDRRFHYRYQAAALAWEAAKLMPNNSDATARLLCDAGSWIKAQDPGAADVFYKALVRRCRKTAIGAEADLLRWFPDFDVDGNMIRTRLEMLELPSAAEMACSEGIARYPTPGRYFIAQSGDHIRYIASAVRRSGFPMTAKEIFAANPEITPSDYIEGREIFIPMPGNAGAEAAPPPEEPATETPPVIPPAETQDGTEYEIRAGDTMTEIAKRFGVTVSSLLDANPGFEPDRMKVGQRFVIPKINSPEIGGDSN